jgi:hypothetical protein
LAWKILFSVLILMVQQANIGEGSANPVGTGERLVNEGECVISIADACGHFWKTIWDHPNNSEVKQARGSPHVLLAGDRLHIPELRGRQENGSTEKRHRFRRKGIPIYFELRIEENGETLSGNRYVLTIEGRVQDGTIPSDGVIKAPMMPQDQTGELQVHIGQKVRIFPLHFGHLDPAGSRSGAHGRLHNLGYVGAEDFEETFSSGLKRFQKENGLSASGELDNATASKLAEIHGS